MLPKLKEAKYRGDYRVWLKFADGVEGEIDLEKELWGEVFQPLRDKTRFAELCVNEDIETIVWPNGADFALEFLYQQLHPDYELRPTPKRDVA